MQITIKCPCLFTLFAYFFFIHATSAYSQVLIEELQRAELPSALLSDHRSKIVLSGNNQLDGRTTAKIIRGQAISGHYRLTSNSDRFISINLTSNKDDIDIELGQFALVYKGRMYRVFPATGLPSPGDGSDIYIGFTATVNPNATEGERYPSYVIDVTED